MCFEVDGDGTEICVRVFVSGFCLSSSNYCSMDCKTCPNKRTLELSILSVGSVGTTVWVIMLESKRPSYIEQKVIEIMKTNKTTISQHAFKKKSRQSMLEAMTQIWARQSWRHWFPHRRLPQNLNIACWEMAVCIVLTLLWLFSI